MSVAPSVQQINTEKQFIQWEGKSVPILSETKHCVHNGGTSTVQLFTAPPVFGYLLSALWMCGPSHTAVNHLTHFSWVRARRQRKPASCCWLALLQCWISLISVWQAKPPRAAALTVVRWAGLGLWMFHHTACAKPSEPTEGERSDLTMNCVPWRRREVGCSAAQVNCEEQLLGGGLAADGCIYMSRQGRTHTHTHCWSSALEAPTESSPVSLHEDMKSSLNLFLSFREQTLILFCDIQLISCPPPGALFGLLTHCGLLMLRLSLMVIFVHGLSESSSSSSFPFPFSSSGSSFFTSAFTVTLGGGSGGLDVLPSACLSWESSGSDLTEASPGAGGTSSLMVTVWGRSSEQEMIQNQQTNILYNAAIMKLLGLPMKRGWGQGSYLFSWCLCLLQPIQVPSSWVLHRRSVASSVRGSSLCPPRWAQAADERTLMSFRRSVSTAAQPSTQSKAKVYAKQTVNTQVHIDASQEITLG